jgi:hypothetical protein
VGLAVGVGGLVGVGECPGVMLGVCGAGLGREQAVKTSARSRQVIRFGSFIPPLYCLWEALSIRRMLQLEALQL